jgi:hypothetical protein
VVNTDLVIYINLLGVWKVIKAIIKVYDGLHDSTAVLNDEVLRMMQYLLGVCEVIKAIIKVYDGLHDSTVVLNDGYSE